MEPTAEQIEAFVAANPDGITDEMMSVFLDGDFDTKADTQAGKAAEPAIEAKPEKQEPETKETPLEEPDLTVLTKDGKHTMPYTVVEELRSELKASRETNAKLMGFVEQLSTGQAERLQAAQQQDKQSGTTEATQEFFSDLELEFPGTKDALQKYIEPLVQKIATMEAERATEKEQMAQAEARVAAQETLDTAVAKAHKDYYDLTAPDNEEFWGWFKKQPSYISVQPKEGYDAQTVIDIITLYKAENTATGSDTAGAKTTGNQEETRKKIAEAIAKAEKQPGVKSLSDIPGSVTPALDEVEALKTMDPLTMLDKFEGKSLEQIMDLTARLSRIIS